MGSRLKYLFLWYFLAYDYAIFTKCDTNGVFMAAYRKLKSGNWNVEMMVSGVRISSTHYSKRNAERWAAEQLQKKHSAYKYTFIESAQRYLDEVSINKRGGKWEEIRIKSLSRTYPRLFGMAISQIETQHIDDFIQERLKSVQPSTVNRELNLLSHVFTKSIKWKWCVVSPISLADRPPNPPPRVRRVSDVEISLVCAALGYFENVPVTTVSQRVAIAFKLAIETALRQGEITKLRGVDINIKNKTILVRAENAKTNTARSIPLSGEAIRLINRVPKSKTDQWLGCRAASVSAICLKAIARSGVPDLTFHDTRHEAITRLASKFQVLDLARISGHKDINELLTYYNRSAADMAHDLV